MKRNAITDINEWQLLLKKLPLNEDVGEFLKSCGLLFPIFNTTKVAVYLFSYKEGKYLYMNDYFEELTGVKKEILMEGGIQAFSKLIHPEDYIAGLDISAQAVEAIAGLTDKEKEDVHFRMFFRIRGKNKNYSWILQQNRIVKWGESAPLADVGYLISLEQDYAPLGVTGMLKTGNREWNFAPREPKVSGRAIDRLSGRELEVLRLIGKGYSIAKIADLLFISPNTVRFHRKNILQKLEVSTMLGAMEQYRHRNDPEK